RNLVRNARIPSHVTGRVKETHSLVLTAHRKRKTDLASFHDRAAARVATYYAEDRPMVVDLVRARFECPEPADDHAMELGASLMGYGGIHCDVLLDRDELGRDLTAIEGPLWCEI